MTWTVNDMPIQPAMTKRDEYAKAAMQALVAHYGGPREPGDEIAKLVKTSFLIADAMMVEDQQ